MSFDMPTLSLTPDGKWPDKTHIAAPPEGHGIVLVTQWDSLRDLQTRAGHGQRTISVVVCHPKRRSHIAITADFQVVPALETDGDTFVWRTYMSKGVQKPTELVWHPNLPKTEERQAWADTIDPRVKKKLTGIARKWSTLPYPDWSVRTWWLPYTVGGQPFNPNDITDWKKLNRQIGEAITQPCGNSGPAGHLAVMFDVERHRRRGQGIQSPLVTVNAAHPAVLTEGDFTLHLLCQTGRCVAQASGEVVFPTRYATVDGVNMMYELLVASGETLDSLWNDPERLQRTVGEAEQTLDRILARPATGKTRTTKTSL